MSILEFKCKIVRLVFTQNEYKIYAVEVDIAKYPFLQLNEYGNVTILGNIHVLTIGNEYSVTAIPKTGKRGFSYEVKNIKMDKPTSKEDTISFLSEILTSRQCNILLSAYPNIIELIEEERTDEIDFTLLNGIKEYTFRKIEQKIKENLIYADLIAELGGQIEFNVIKKLFDEFTSMEMVKRKLKTEGYRCLMNLSRIGFKRADDIMINIYKSCLEKLSEDKVPPIMFDYNLIESPQRCEAVVRHILESNENNDGNTKMKISEVLNMCEQLTPECKQHFNTVINYQDMFYHDDEYIALVETYNAEKFIADRLLEGLSYNNIWDYNTARYRSIGDNLELSDQQSSVLDLICKENIVLLIGNAGCGKSSSAQAIINMAKDNGITYKLMSPTAKAAKVLKEYTKEETSTIHRALGLGMEKTTYDNDVLFEDLIIVDEVSMLDVRLAKILISSIDFTRTKLLLIGDDSQLPSIGAGNLLHDLIQSNIIPTVKLTQVFRNSGGVLKTSIYIRNQQIYLQDNGQIQYIGDDNGYCFIPVAQEYCVDQVVNGYKTLLENGYKPEEIMVLSAYNKGDYGTTAINKLLQPLGNPLGGKGDGIKVFDTDFYINDMVMQTVNNYHAVKYQEFNNIYKNKSNIWEDEYDLDIYDEEDTSEEVFIANGETGKIKNIIREKEGKYKVVIEFDGILVEYDSNDMTQIRHAYCISTHKSQGSNARIVILITPKAHAYMLNSNLLYVGDTRAREKVFHIGDTITINRAIKKKVDFNRETYLKSLLETNIKVC